MPYTWHVRCLAPPSDDTDLALWVNFDEARLLFGCGEGTTRLFVQRRLGMRGLKGIFLPGGGIQSAGGLAGAIMTYADAGAKHLDIIGPSDTSQLVACLRGAVGRDSLKLNIVDAPLDAGPDRLLPVFSTPVFTVKALVLRLKSQSGSTPSPPDPLDVDDPAFLPTQLTPSQLQAYSQLLSKSVARDRTTESRPSLPFPILDRLRSLPPAMPEVLDSEMVYVCQAAEVRGKFDVERSKALGVPKGPLMSKLVGGESIEVQVNGDTRTVRPEDVLAPPTRGAVLLVVNCSAHNLDHLLQTPALDQFQCQQDGQAPETEVQLVVHRISAEVWTDTRYHDWLGRFGPSTKHLLAPTTHYGNRISFRSFAWNALALSALDDELFHIPKYIARPQLPIPEHLRENVSVMETNDRVHMRPLKELDQAPPAPRDVPFPATTDELEAALAQTQLQQAPYWQAAQEARQRVRQDPRWDAPSSRVGDDITVTTLGTGSALPSKHRNVSSTVLDIPDFGYVMLDSGEGTLGQLRRWLGSERVEHFHRHLRLLYISHMHADHHLGLQYILEDRMRSGVTSKLYIVAPDEIALAMQEVGAWQASATPEALANIVFLRVSATSYWGRYRASSTPPPPSPDLSLDFLSGVRQWPRTNVFQPTPGAISSEFQALLDDLDLDSIQAVPMPHRGKAWGLVLQHRSGWKIAYSGDTQPCKAFVEAGRGATLCIHEATLEDDKPEVAAEKGHSTMSQAIDIGQRMGAKYILLTHFSQRYPKLPKSSFISSAQADGNQAVVSISFDLMSVKLKDMWRMEYYMEALNLLFPPEEEAEDVVEDGEPLGAGANGTQASANGSKKKQGKPSKKEKVAGGRSAEIPLSGESSSSKRSSTSSPTGKEGKKVRSNDVVMGDQL